MVGAGVVVRTAGTPKIMPAKYVFLPPNVAFILHQLLGDWCSHCLHPIVLVHNEQHSSTDVTVSDSSMFGRPQTLVFFRMEQSETAAETIE